MVQEGATIGRDCRIGSGSIIGPGVTVGDNTQVEFQVEHCLHSQYKGVLGYNIPPQRKLFGVLNRMSVKVALQHCSIGSSCSLDSGSQIGARGLVFRPSAAGGLEQPKESQVWYCLQPVEENKQAVSSHCFHAQPQSCAHSLLQFCQRDCSFGHCCRPSGQKSETMSK